MADRYKKSKSPSRKTVSEAKLTGKQPGSHLKKYKFSWTIKAGKKTKKNKRGYIA